MTQEIDYKETEFFSKLIVDYLENKAALKPFLAQFNALKNYRAQIDAKQFSDKKRQILVQSLQKQYKNIETDPKVSHNTALLLQPNTYTVTTGHQLSIVGNPLYFLYKIAGTITLCNELSKAYPNENFVPVFWLASEDHDFEEIASFKLFNQNYAWETTQTGAVGRMQLEELKSIFSEDFFKKLENETYFEKLKNVLKNVYLESQNLAEATQKFVNTLFGAYGIVVLNADEKALKTLFAPFITKDIQRQYVQPLVIQSTKKLQDLGYKPQVFPRPINFFYMKNNLRQRLVFEENTYSVLGTDIKFSEAEILEEINTNPQNFSPNVVMRPLYQETILPNIAYIGGGGELAYWLQLKAVFDASDVAFPILVLRNSILFVSKNNAKKQAKLGITATNIFKTTEILQKEYLQSQPEETNFEAEKQHFMAIFEQIKLKIKDVEASLLGFAEGEQVRILKQIDGIEAKLKKSQKQKYETELSQILALKQSLFPDGNLQERTDNFLPYYLSEGDGFIATLVENCNPLHTKFKIITKE